jgi:DNA-directed RNA polymerase specialized sigma24 family protein
MVNAVICDREEELDALVHRLIIQALQHSSGTKQRTQAIESLLILTEKLTGILTQQRLDPPLRPYYDEALRYTENSVRNSLDKFPGRYQLDLFNTESAIVRKYFARWYNLILKRDCQDLWRRRKKRPKPVNLDESIGDEGGVTRAEITADPRYLEPMDALIQAENQAILNQIIEYLQKDPNGELRNCLSDKHRPYTGWELIQRRLLKYPPDKWKDIAQELNISYGTVTSDWERYCKPLLEQIRQQFGYEVE